MPNRILDLSVNPNRKKAPSKETLDRQRAGLARELSHEIGFVAEAQGLTVAQYVDKVVREAIARDKRAAIEAHARQAKAIEAWIQPTKWDRLLELWDGE